jgi:hypothetical protein
MSYTMEDFIREDLLERFRKMTREERRVIYQSLPLEERRAVSESLPLEERLAGLSADQIRKYLDQLAAGRQAASRKPRRKK